jgi:hypothetical protein
MTPLTHHDDLMSSPPEERGTSLSWWAPRVMLVIVGAFLGAEIGVWAGEPGELDRLAASVGAVTQRAASPAPSQKPAAVAAAPASMQDGAWHASATASASARIPSVDISVLPRAPSASARGARTAARVARPSPHAPAKSGVDDTLDPTTLPTALTDALGE